MNDMMFFDPVFVPENPTALLITKFDNKTLMVHRHNCRFKNHSTKYRHRITTSEDYEAFSKSYASRNTFTKEKVETLQHIHGYHALDLSSILIKDISTCIDYPSSSPDTYAITARVGKVFVPVIEQSSVNFKDKENIPMTDSLKTQLKNLENLQMLYKEDGTKFKMLMKNGTLYNINPEVYLILSKLCANRIPIIGVAAQPASLIVDRRIVEACKKRKDIEKATGEEEYTPYLTIGDEDALRIFDEVQKLVNKYLEGDV